MNWNLLTRIEQLNAIDLESEIQTVLILKHSTRCGISSMALSRLERKWQAEDSQKIKPYYLDLIRYREVSNAIVTRYGILHESPQVLVIRNGRCIYSATHSEIVYEEIFAKL